MGPVHKKDLDKVSKKGLAVNICGKEADFSFQISVFVSQPLMPGPRKPVLEMCVLDLDEKRE